MAGRGVFVERGLALHDQHIVAVGSAETPSFRDASGCAITADGPQAAP